MSVVSVEEIPNDRGGLDAGSVDDLGESRTWLIEAADASVTRFQIVNHSTYISSSIPNYLAPHPENVFYTCRSVRLEHQSGKYWYATANYSTQPISREERERSETPNPVNRLTRFSVDSVEFQTYRNKDARGVPYNNSADVPYPPQIHEDSRSILHVRKNIGSFRTDWYLLRNSVNKSQITVYDGASSVTIQAGNGLLKRLVMGFLTEENGVQFYTLSADIHVSTNGWKKELLDQGFQALDDSGNLVAMKVYDSDSDGDSSGELIDTVEELPLNGEGKPLKKPDGTYTDPLKDSIQFNEFDEFREEDWSSLPFWT